MKKIPLILLLLTVVFGFWGAARMHEHLWDYRTRHQLLPAAPLEDAPPLMAFTTVALGGFRGLIADLLWIRTMRLQQEGRIFEIAQLADWITKLEPHFTTVWAFQAWNMAYNISVLFSDAENRWRRVNNGIQLLRDEGLRYNPCNPNLYKELGWLYQHKIGYIMDSAHLFYRRKLAETMQTALLEAQLPIHPRKADPESPPAQRGINLALAARYARPSEAGKFQRLREELKLDPALMRQLDAEYGPFDWRLPETHAIYWAWRGRATVTPGTPDAPDTPGIRACNQMIFQCLSAAFRQGRLDFDPATDLYVTTPNLDLLPQAMKAYEEAIARCDKILFNEVYANFLGEAVIILRCYGRDALSREIYRQMFRRYGIADPAMSYEDFIAGSFAGMQKNDNDLPPPDAVAVVEGFLFQAIRQQAAGDSPRAAEYERRARAFWDTYMQARASEDHRLRTGLPELDILRRQAERRAREDCPE